ncbi:hypothetical protein BU24DRAFT_418422 [Aaosphaeria arxii CBS 175.79]|uniref:Apple domain-containing protein n=1 Tax=Aaosphaeria arxii CBS 175.79 TaxID=1450172 RepID=A0A6A5Y0Z1_9PLEO|nr:uncharacterized protein BU24DRAFT_418422 [Aaosphaeria arxii CBS 175.79]KAF2018863.1 hypothetical protein BU24DRAFT_418422 [Aaosphaeria arxii CBS 175.79]
MRVFTLFHLAIFVSSVVISRYGTRPSINEADNSIRGITKAANAIAGKACNSKHIGGPQPCTRIHIGDHSRQHPAGQKSSPVRSTSSGVRVMRSNGTQQDDALFRLALHALDTEDSKSRTLKGSTANTKGHDMVLDEAKVSRTTQSCLDTCILLSQTQCLTIRILQRKQCENSTIKNGCEKECTIDVQ